MVISHSFPISFFVNVYRRSGIPFPVPSPGDSLGSEKTQTKAGLEASKIFIEVQRFANPHLLTGDGIHHLLTLTGA